MKFLDLDGLKYYHQALCNKFNLTPYSKKTETVKDIEVFDPNRDSDDDDAPSKTSIRIEFADGTHKYVDVPEASGPFKVVNTTYPGNAGFMSISDKTKLDSIPIKYIPTSDGVINESMTFSKNIYLKDVYITGYIAGENQDEGVRFNGCSGIEHFNQDEAMRSKLWNAQGGTIDISEILSNAAIYVAGNLDMIDTSIDSTTVINNPDSVIFDKNIGGVFFAKKGSTYYAHWNADILKNIAPPSRYGIETKNGVFPFNNQMYKFDNDKVYIATCSHGLCTMTELDKVIN